MEYFYTTPPSSWATASYFQILSVFIPLLFLITFFSNIFINYLPQSFIISLGFIFILFLWSLKIYFFFTAPLALAITIYFAVSFPKIKFKKKLTQPQKIPKLTRMHRT